MTDTGLETRKEEPLPVEWIEHVKVLDVQPGDLLVLRPPATMSDTMVSNAQWMFRRLCPQAALIVLQPGMDLGVLRAEVKT